MHALIVDWLTEPARQRLYNLQRSLEQQNGIPAQAPVEAFLLTSEERSALPGYNPHTQEQVFVTQSGDNPGLGVYINEGVLERLPAAVPSLEDRRALDEYCVAAEGVSHFLYIAQRAEEERQVTLYELELQAEVDKFVHLYEALRPASSQPLIEALFERYTLHEALSAEERARYHSTSRDAAKFCHRLAKQAGSMRRAAREFFGLPLEAKLRHVSR